MDHNTFCVFGREILAILLYSEKVSRVCQREFLASGSCLDDRYRIERVLGQGGMGVVYLAIDRKDRRVAIKELRLEGTEARRQFRREAEILGRLRHPNLVAYRQFFTVEDQDYLVMDYVAGLRFRRS